MDTHTDSISINYDELMSGTVGESSELEKELPVPAEIKRERLSDDESQIDRSVHQGIINTSELEAMTLDYITVQNNVTNTEGDNKYIIEWTNEENNDKVQPMTDSATSKVASGEFCGIDDILAIFPFVCGICDEKFKCVSIYLKHISLHETTNSYLLHSCSQVDTGFDEKVTLFTCGICNIKFPSLCSLYKHLMDSENVNDFVFKSCERTVYAYNETENMTENTGATDKDSRTSRTRKRASRQLNQDAEEVHTLAKKQNVRLSASRLISGSSQDSGNKVNSGNTKNEAEKSNKMVKKSKTVKKKTVKKSKTCGKNKKKGSNEQVNVRNVSATGKQGTKINDSVKGNPQTKTKKVSSGRPHFASNDADDNNIEDDFNVVENVTDNVEDNVEMNKEDENKIDYHIEHVEMKEEVDDDIEDNVKVKENVDATCSIKDNVDKKTDNDVNIDVEVKEEVDNNIEDHVEAKDDSKTDNVDNADDDNDEITSKTKKKNSKTKINICEMCGASFTHKCSLKVHINSVHTNSTPYKCCGKGFRDKTTFIRHRKHGHKKSNHCQSCGKSFGTRHDLHAHQRQVHDEKKEKCDCCGMMFARKADLKSHQTVHNETRLYICHCGKTFKFHSGLWRHKKICNNLNSENQIMTKMNICKYCGQILKTSSSLNEHEKRHLNKGRYKCPICCKASFSKYHHETHVKRHSLDKPYCCSKCGATFKTFHDLRRHEQRKQERLMCDKCGKVYYSAAELKDHMGTHIDVARHVCTYAGCGKSFRYRNNFYRHRKSHEGIHFTCDHCGKQYDSNSALVAHVKYIESQEMFECSICKKQYKTKQTLQKHRNEQH